MKTRGDGGFFAKNVQKHREQGFFCNFYQTTTTLSTGRMNLAFASLFHRSPYSRDAMLFAFTSHSMQLTRQNSNLIIFYPKLHFSKIHAASVSSLSIDKLKHTKKEENSQLLANLQEGEEHKR
jgi:hypothetical protein